MSSFPSDKMFLLSIHGLWSSRHSLYNPTGKTIFHPAFKFKHNKGKKYLCKNNGKKEIKETKQKTSKHHISAITKKKSH